MTVTLLTNSVVPARGQERRWPPADRLGGTRDWWEELVVQAGDGHRQRRRIEHASIMVPAPLDATVSVTSTRPRSRSRHRLTAAWTNSPCVAATMMSAAARAHINRPRLQSWRQW